MTTSLLSDAFAHHFWATQRLVDECATLTSLGLTPPEVDLWSFGEAAGRTLVVPAPAP